MPTVAEVLKSAGLTDEQITAMDAKALAGFTTVLSAAEAERSQAELAQRAANDFYETQITPALNTWGSKEAELTARVEYYKTIADKAKDNGFIAEVPPFKAGETTQPRTEGGRFVANANPVAGSPDLARVRQDLGTALGNLADLQWSYRKLNDGKEMPDSPTKLAEEAAAQRMGLVEYAAKKYDFAGREKALADADKAKERDAIRKEAIEERDKFYAERGGANPNVRQGAVSQFAEVKKAVAEGKRQDPLQMTREQRHAATAAAIRQDTAERVQ